MVPPIVLVLTTHEGSQFQVDLSASYPAQFPQPCAEALRVPSGLSDGETAVDLYIHHDMSLPKHVMGGHMRDATDALGACSEGMYIGLNLGGRPSGRAWWTQIGLRIHMNQHLTDFGYQFEKSMPHPFSRLMPVGHRGERCNLDM